MLETKIFSKQEYPFFLRIILPNLEFDLSYSFHLFRTHCLRNLKLFFNDINKYVFNLIVIDNYDIRFHLNTEINITVIVLKKVGSYVVQ